MDSTPEPTPLVDFLRTLEEERRELARKNQERVLALPRGTDFTSNDYLGLTGHPHLARVMQQALETPPFGAAASRLLRGNHQSHLDLERRLALWKGTESALLFPTGYSANVGTMSALIGREDRAFSDELNHASIIDGLRLTGCRREIYPHLDLSHLENRLKETHTGGRTFIISETLFSMEGDQLPLPRLAKLAEEHGALFILDDSHATGLYGEQGSGLVEEAQLSRQPAAIISTCGKALGLLGAFVAGPQLVIDHLVNRARSFIFTTAPPPVLVAGIGAALDIIAREPWRRRQVEESSRHLREQLHHRGIEVKKSAGPIVPLILGDEGRALQVAASVQEQGFDVRAIRPPTVPAGSARLRLSAHADHKREEIDGLCDALAGAIFARTSGGIR